MWRFSFSEDHIDTEGKEMSHHQHSSRMDISYACRFLNRWHQEILPTRGAQLFQKSRSYLKILCTGKVTWCKFHSEDQQILGIIIQNLIAWVTFCPGFVQPCFQQWYSHWAFCVKSQENYFKGNSGIADTCSYCWEKIWSTDFLITPKIAIIILTSYM